MNKEIGDIIDEIESIVSDLDYGDITRNKIIDRLDGVVANLGQLTCEKDDE